jgi:hypothetical protein
MYPIIYTYNVWRLKDATRKIIKWSDR